MKALTDLESDEVRWRVGLSGVGEKDVLRLEVSVHYALPIKCSHGLRCNKRVQTLYHTNIMHPFIYYSTLPTFFSVIYIFTTTTQCLSCDHAYHT